MTRKKPFIFSKKFPRFLAEMLSDCQYVPESPNTFENSLIFADEWKRTADRWIREGKA